METLEFIGAVTIQPSIYKAALNVTGLIQKLVQASMYHFSLRHKVPRKNKKEGASWYLRIVALFNYAMWLHSMANTGGGAVQEMLGTGMSIVSSAMIALLIDYRLLCCMMFAEHSMEVYDNFENKCTDNDDDIIIVGNVRKFEVSSSQMSGLGCVFGFIMIVLQLICGLQNFRLVGAWSNIFAIIADVAVVLLGFQLLSLDSKRKNASHVWRKTDARGVDMMVAIMGIVGFVYWVMLTIIEGTWMRKLNMLTAEEVSYLRWGCAKNIFRAAGIIFQLYIFIRSDSLFGCREGVKGKKALYFLFPAIMFSLLSMFIMAVMDGNNKLMGELITTSGVDTVLDAFMKVGEPLYLGFCLHLFLHFFIAFNNIRALRPTDSVENGHAEIEPFVEEVGV